MDIDDARRGVPMRRRNYVYGIIGLAVSACTSTVAGHDNTPSPDAADPVSVDAPPADLGQTVSGVAMDYFTNAPLPTTSVATDGIDPQMTATSAVDGTWELDHVPTGSKLFLSTTRTNYVATRNLVTTVTDVPVIQNIYIGSITDTHRQYTSVGLAPANNVGKAIVFAELQDAAGTPLVGFPLTNVTLLDAAQAPVTPSGIYFIGTVGDVDPLVTIATAEIFPIGTPARSRVALLGVPPGSYTLSVNYGTTAAPLIVTTGITALADGFELALAKAGTNTTAQPTDPTFATDIYPMLQRAAAGGLGCANCHTAGGLGAVLKYDDPAITVLANMNAITGVLNLTTPATSLLLVRPLYEQPPALQDHPNATFLDITDPNYTLFLLWITNGAKP
jgi:hypothetical protein